MSEITIIWNQPEPFRDISELWNASDRDGLRILSTPREDSACDCYPKNMEIDGMAGYMVLPGIYYFGDRQAFPTTEKLNRIHIKRKTAVMAIKEDDDMFSHNPPFDYLAVDEENIEVLKKIQKTRGEKFYIKELNSETREQIEDMWESWGAASPDLEKILEETMNAIPVEDTAEELMPGIGIRDICVGLKTVFMPRREVEQYAYAYRSGDMLVLIRREFDAENGRKEYDLRMLEELIVRRTQVLRCGALFEWDYPVINCGSQKEQQMMTPEAYELFRRYKETMAPYIGAEYHN